MDGLALRVLRDFEQMRHHEIRLCGWGWAHHEGLVHGLRVLGVHVCLRVDTHSLDAQSVGRATDAASDLATIRNQKLVEHLLVLDFASISATVDFIL